MSYVRFQNRRAKDNKKRKMLQLRQKQLGKYIYQFFYEKIKRERET